MPQDLSRTRTQAIRVALLVACLMGECFVGPDLIRGADQQRETHWVFALITPQLTDARHYPTLLILPGLVFAAPFEQSRRELESVTFDSLECIEYGAGDSSRSLCVSDPPRTTAGFCMLIASLRCPTFRSFGTLQVDNRSLGLEAPDLVSAEQFICPKALTNAGEESEGESSRCSLPSSASRSLHKEDCKALAKQLKDSGEYFGCPAGSRPWSQVRACAITL